MEVAGAEGISKRYARRILRLSILSPEISEAIPEGMADLGLMLERLEKGGVPVAWGGEQHRELAGRAR